MLVGNKSVHGGGGNYSAFWTLIKCFLFTVRPQFGLTFFGSGRDSSPFCCILDVICCIIEHKLGKCSCEYSMQGCFLAFQRYLWPHLNSFPSHLLSSDKVGFLKRKMFNVPEVITRTETILCTVNVLI